MLDADAKERVEQTDCVFGDELFERNQERCAQCEHAIDWSWTGECMSVFVVLVDNNKRYLLCRRVASQPMPHRIDEKRKYRRDHRDEQDELRKFLPSPGSLEVFASKPDDCG